MESGGGGGGLPFAFGVNDAKQSSSAAAAATTTTVAIAKPKSKSKPKPNPLVVVKMMMDDTAARTETRFQMEDRVEQQKQWSVSSDTKTPITPMGSASSYRSFPASASQGNGVAAGEKINFKTAYQRMNFPSWAGLSASKHKRFLNSKELTEPGCVVPKIQRDQVEKRVTADFKLEEARRAGHPVMVVVLDLPYTTPPRWMECMVMSPEKRSEVDCYSGFCSYLGPGQCERCRSYYIDQRKQSVTHLLFVIHRAVCLEAFVRGYMRAEVFQKYCELVPFDRMMGQRRDGEEEKIQLALLQKDLAIASNSGSAAAVTAALETSVQQTKLLFDHSLNRDGTVLGTLVRFTNCTRDPVVML